MTSGPPLRVFIVEDDVEARAAVCRAFERSGYEVVTRSDVDGALAFASDKSLASPDVAVLDVVLGSDDEGGLRVLEALRATHPRTKAIVVTAFADVAKVKRSLNLGASHLIEKPFRASELLSVVARLLAARDEPTVDVPRAFERAGLTRREGEVALLALKGLSSPEIADVLSMSEKTVRQHLTKVYEKNGVRGRGELIHLFFPL